MGTSGSTQGERNEASPALNAIAKVIDVFIQDNALVWSGAAGESSVDKLLPRGERQNIWHTLEQARSDKARCALMYP